MAKGNYIAYQALRPTESKVGDIFAANIDQMIKAGEAKRAAELQRKLAEGKSLAEIMKGEKIEYKNTITPLNNAVGKMTNEGINALSDAQISAENINIPIEERMSKVRKAKEFANQVREMQSMASDPSLIDAYKKNQEKIAQGKAFEGDSNIALYTALQTGYIDLRRGENGLEIGYIENINDPEKKVVYKPFQEVKQQYVTPVKDDVVPVYDKWLFDASQRVTTKETNSNGYVEKSRAFFDIKQAQKLLYDKFGFAEGADVDENYNINAIPDELNQLFYRKEKRNISNKEDFKSALDYSLSIMQGYSDKSTSTKVLKTALDIEEQKLDIRNKKIRPQPQGTTESPLGNGTMNVGDVILKIGKDGSAFQTKGVNYFVSGTTEGGKESKLGITTYWNPNAKKDKNGKPVGGWSYGMSLPSKDGNEVVIKGVNSVRASQILSANKVKNPENVLAYMATIASQNGLNVNPKPIKRRNIPNYDVDFTTDYAPKQSGGIGSGGFTTTTK